MTFLQLQNAKLEQSESMNWEHSSNEESSRNSSFNILDQIKRSAGSTPAKTRLAEKQQEFVDVTIRNSDTGGGFASFNNNAGLVEATSRSTSTEDVPTAFSLFQGSSSRTKDDGNCDEYGESWTSPPFVAANSMDQLKGKRLQQQQQQKQNVGPVERTFRRLDAQHTVSTSKEEISSKSASPLHSYSEGSQSSTDTSWEEDGDHHVVSGSLLDQTTDGEDDDDYTTILPSENEDEGIDDSEDDESLLNDTTIPITAVESFLDELAEVDNVHQLGNLLLQVGSCNFPEAANKVVYMDQDDDDYTVDSDVFPAVGASQLQRGRSTSPRSLPTSNATTFSSLLEQDYGTVDASFGQVFQTLSLTADSILEIMGSYSTVSNSNDEDQTTTSTPNNANRSFFESMFGCHHG